MKYYCCKCIAEKVNVRLVKPLGEIWGGQGPFTYGAKMGPEYAGNKCAICGDDAGYPIFAHPEMDKFTEEGTSGD